VIEQALIEQLQHANVPRPVPRPNYDKAGCSSALTQRTLVPRYSPRARIAVPTTELDEARADMLMPNGTSLEYPLESIRSVTEHQFKQVVVWIFQDFGHI
jgi:hypothetical protein